MEHTKHIWRACLLIVVLAVGGISVRHFAIPDSFGVTGFYRYDSLAEFMAKEPVHGSPTACNSCHGDVAELKATGKHATVSCEVCHAPLDEHVRQDQKVADMPIHSEAARCAYCHQKLVARPATMPQVDLEDHLISQEVLQRGEAIPDGTCAACHDVHSPGI